jgi:hypothetical protein
MQQDFIGIMASELNAAENMIQSSFAFNDDAMGTSERNEVEDRRSDAIIQLFSVGRKIAEVGMPSLSGIRLTARAIRAVDAGNIKTEDDVFSRLVDRLLTDIELTATLN